MDLNQINIISDELIKRSQDLVNERNLMREEFINARSRENINDLRSVMEFHLRVLESDMLDEKNICLEKLLRLERCRNQETFS